jgi:hypothetical protein
MGQDVEDYRAVKMATSDNYQHSHTGGIKVVSEQFMRAAQA